jgi:SAM-dependent methyltransferase
VKLGLLGRAPASYDETFVGAMASAYLEQTPWTRLRLASVRDLVEPKPGERVLDLGSAGGAVSHFLSTYGCDVVGVDSETLAVQRATELFPGLRFEVADVASLPFGDGTFDKAVAADLVEHLDDAAFVRMLQEVARVLVRGGTLSIYTPNARHPVELLKERDLLLARNETHIGLRDARTLADALVQAGFEIERDEWRPSFFAGLRSLERLGGPYLEALRYRLCLRARTPRDGR